MKAIRMSFIQMLRLMKQDIMLITIAIVPFIAGVAFRFVIPVAENLLTDYWDMSTILSPYYELFDLFLIILTPTMLNYIVAMMILEEADDHMIACLAVAPLGKSGYLISRLGFASLIAWPFSVIVAWLFRLSDITMPMTTGIALSGTIQGIVVAFLIVCLSTNKVEGMAVGKMTTLFNLGMLAPYFTGGKVQYFLSLFPSFWMAKAVQSVDYFSLAVSILLALLWVAFLYKRFIKKIAR